MVGRDKVNSFGGVWISLVKWMADMMAPQLGFGGGGTTNI